MVFETAILALPAGWGKTAIASAMQEHIGFRRIVTEWPGTSRMVQLGCLHLTNNPEAIA